MSRLPLHNIRVLDFTHQYAGPHCGRILSDLGAEVIKVESIQHPDSHRVLVPAENKMGTDYWNRGGLGMKRNTGKYGITLNLNDSAGVDIFKRLVLLSDVIIESYSRRVMKNFGLEYDALKQLKPDIIMISLSGYGHSGPWADYIGYGAGLEPAAGISFITGYADGPPIRTALSYTNPLSGIAAAGAVLTALHYRRRTGKGQYIDLSERDTVIGSIAQPVMDYIMNKRVWGRAGNRNPVMAPHGCYRCKGHDRWVAIAVPSEEHWHRFCKALGNPSWTTEPRFQHVLGRIENQDELDRNVEQWTCQHEHYEAMSILQKAGVPAGAVLTNKELLMDPHLKERGFFEVLDHPVVGKRPLPKQFPAKFSASQVGPKRPAPLLGEHNKQILTQLLGLSEDEVSKLEQQRVIGTVPIGILEGDQPPPATTELALDILQKVGAIIAIEDDYLRKLGLEKQD